MGQDPENRSMTQPFTVVIPIYPRGTALDIMYGPAAPQGTRIKLEVGYAAAQSRH